MRAMLLAAGLVVASLLVPCAADAHCRCHRVRAARCADRTTKHRLTVTIDLAVTDDAVEVVTQTGPYRVPVADLDGKQVLFIVTPLNVVFQGFLEDIVPGSLQVGPMQGAHASFTTDAVFVPGEYELALFIDSAPGGGLGPQRGDIAAFDNTVCDPTGVTVRLAIGCEDTAVTLTNRHFIIF